MACGSTLLLVINRVFDVLHRPLSEFLFDGKRVFFSIALIVIYGTLIAMFSPSIIFNSVIMAWIADPLTIDPEYKTDEISEYVGSLGDLLRIMNQTIVVSKPCSIYKQLDIRLRYLLSLCHLLRSCQQNATRTEIESITWSIHSIKYHLFLQHLLCHVIQRNDVYPTSPVGCGHRRVVLVDCSWMSGYRISHNEPNNSKRVFEVFQTQKSQQGIERPNWVTVESLIFICRINAQFA